MPAQLAKAITSVEGLDNLGGGRSTMHVRLGSGTPKTRLAKTTDSIAAGRGPAPHVLESVFYNGLIAFGPGDFYTFYDETPLLSQGVNGSGGGCIGLIEIGDYDSQGVTNFDEIFDLPTPVITRVISPDSDNPGINSRSDETMLDLLYAHAIAPGAPINVYLTDFNASPYNGDPITSTIDSLNAAVDQDTCSALSISIESCGFPASFYTGALHTTYMKAASQGQTVFVAEGDEGAAEFQPSSTGQGCVTGTSQHVNELASDPFVTSIGGTQFEPNYDKRAMMWGMYPNRCGTNRSTQAKVSAQVVVVGALFSKSPPFSSWEPPMTEAAMCRTSRWRPPVRRPACFRYFHINQRAATSRRHWLHVNVNYFGRRTGSRSYRAVPITSYRLLANR